MSTSNTVWVVCDIQSYEQNDESDFSILGVFSQRKDALERAEQQIESYNLTHPDIVTGSRTSNTQQWSCERDGTYNRVIILERKMNDDNEFCF